MPQRPPDWQLPPGVTPGLWEYLHQEELAANYLAAIATSPVINADQEWVARRLGTTGLVLDLGCGPGRSLIPLAQRGFDCIGVDLSDAMLQQAVLEAAQADVRINWLKANLVELDCLVDNSVDHLLCLFSTLGMIQPAAARRKVVTHAYRILKPGGTFLLHVHNRWFLRRQQGWGKLLGEWLRSWQPGYEAQAEPMPVHQGVANLMIHAFTKNEVTTLLRAERFTVMEVRSLSLRADGSLKWPWLLNGLRAHGYLIAARKDG